MGEFSRRTSTGIIGGAFFFGIYTIGSIYFSILLAGILVGILVFEWPRLVHERIWWVFTLVYPMLPVAILIYSTMVYRDSNWLIPLYPFLVAWIGDTGAYIVGKSIGKHKVCPSISPKKSWEGLLGGLACIFIANLALGPYILFLKMSLVTLFLLSVVITTVGFMGDIFISYLKRKSNLKDTGVILPGHGGLLDRFDSVFFIAYVFGLLLL